MPAIIRDLPFYARPTTVEVRGRSVPVKRDQIIVWVSLSEMGLRQLYPNAARLPALFDTGCNHSFVIRERQLIEWAGVHPEYLRTLSSTRLFGNPIPQLAANVWFHPNRSGHRDEFSDRPPFLLETVQGIAVVPEAEGATPRLPLLGLPVLRWNHLLMSLDGDRSRVTIRTRRRFRFFG